MFQSLYLPTASKFMQMIVELSEVSIFAPEMKEHGGPPLPKAELGKVH